ITTRYAGGKSCLLIHGEGATITTTAPRDIGGEGGAKAFSPTDLVAAGLAACILTTAAMFAERHGISLEGATASVEKHMTAPPAQRRIARLPVTVTLPASVPLEMRPRVEAAGNTCPVHASLHPDVESPITYRYA
ncbi:MAG: OsmC family protein, partial [Phycisphaerales bacterium]|nr:OsmC family protein [Phycisphaerales bacterium]